VSLRAPPDQTNGLAGDHPREWSYEPVVDLPVRRTQTGDLPGPDPAIGLAGRQMAGLSLQAPRLLRTAHFRLTRQPAASPVPADARFPLVVVPGAAIGLVARLAW